MPVLSRERVNLPQMRGRDAEPRRKGREKVLFATLSSYTSQYAFTLRMDFFGRKIAVISDVAIFIYFDALCMHWN